MPDLLAWTASAWQDYLYWQTQDRKTLTRINRLVQACLRDPHAGLGKPEALQADLRGFWSRRIDHKNRLVYAVNRKTVTIISCRYHY